MSWLDWELTRLHADLEVHRRESRSLQRLSAIVSAMAPLFPWLWGQKPTFCTGKDTQNGPVWQNEEWEGLHLTLKGMELLWLLLTPLPNGDCVWGTWETTTTLRTHKQEWKKGWEGRSTWTSTQKHGHSVRLLTSATRWDNAHCQPTSTQGSQRSPKVPPYPAACCLQSTWLRTQRGARG